MPFIYNLLIIAVLFVTGVALVLISAPTKKIEGLNPIVVAGCMILVISLTYAINLKRGIPADIDLLAGVPYCTEFSAGGDARRYVLQNAQTGKEYFMASKTTLPSAGCFVKTTDGKFLPVALPGYPIPAPTSTQTAAPTPPPAQKPEK